MDTSIDYFVAEMYIPLKFVSNDETIKGLIDQSIRTNENDEQDDQGFNFESVIATGEWEGAYSQIRVAIHDTGEGDLLELYHPERKYGEFEELEAYCRENDIPYNRFTRDDSESESNYVNWFRPGMHTQHPMMTYVQNDAASIPVPELRKIVDEAPEIVTDAYVLELLLKRIEEYDFDSATNKLANFA